MSYLIWLFWGGKHRYPTGGAWLILSIIRIIDWIAFLGVLLFFIVNLAGYAIDARAYVHHKALERQYDISLLASEDQSYAIDTRDNYRRVEKQKALMGWYGEMLIFEEQVWDQWRSLFDKDGRNAENIALIPFFWVNGFDSVNNSTVYLDGYYSRKGIDGRNSNTDSMTKFDYDLRYVYKGPRDYTKNAIEKLAPDDEALFKRYLNCEVPTDLSFISYFTSNPNYYRDVDFYKSQLDVLSDLDARGKKSDACFFAIQDELKVKRYPTENMLAYNDIVINYHKKTLENALQFAKEQKAQKGKGFYGVKRFNPFGEEWDKEKYLRYFADCNRDCEDTFIANEDWHSDKHNLTLEDTAFYDIVVKKNELYDKELVKQLQD